MDEELMEIFRSEMSERLVSLRNAMALTGSPEVRTRAEALETAYLEVHTLKGNAAQLGFDKVAALATAMQTALDNARQQKAIDTTTSARIDKAASLLTDWMLKGDALNAQLAIATAGFSLDGVNA